MVAVDYYPDEEGSIVDGLICGFCYADAAVDEGQIVKWGTSASGRVAVTSGAAVGDGIGVALKTASGAGAIIPVAFSGIVKMTTAETLAIGELVISASSLAVVGVGASTTITINSATQKILGCTMQAGLSDDGDELLVLLGGDGISAGNV
jgi:hypothetical protein